MPIPVSKHRLRSSAFERQDEVIKVDASRLFFLSVEGDETERNYFEHLSEHLDNSLVKIEVLRHRRGDGYSDPNYVIELLTEYLNIRDGELIPDDLLQKLVDKYTKDVLDAYLSNSDTITKITRKSIEDDLLLLGIDMNYRRYLQNMKTHSDDVFAVILDRDCGNHSRELMEKCVQKCQDNGFGCFITNPCFEFWLLLHLRDVKSVYSEEDLAAMLENQKISNAHTVVSKEVCNYASHGKKISSKKFEKFYLPNIASAMAHANDFASDYPDLLDRLGTNLPKLLCLLVSPKV